MSSLSKKDKILSLCAITFCTLFFYRCIYKLGIHSIDDWGTVNTNSYGWKAALSGVINSIVKPQRHLFADTITRLLNFCQIGPHNMVLYRIFTFIGIAVSVWYMYIFLKKLIDSNFAIRTVILFMFGAQIFDLNYNGFISFSWVYQIQMSLVFICLILHLDYYKTLDKKYLFWEAVMYFTACCFYESFIFICFPILAITIFKLKESGVLTLKRAFTDLWIPATGAILFASIYFYFYLRESSFSYAGTQVGSELRFSEVLLTLANLTFSNTPGYLTLADGSRALTFIVSHLMTDPFLYLVILFIALIGGFSFFTLNKKRETNRQSALSFLIVISLITALFIALPLSLTSHYIGGVCSGMLVNYGVSYYCWFFVSIALCALLQILSQSINMKWFQVTICTLFVMISFFAMSSNDYYQKSRNEKFYSAETVARSNLFLSDSETLNLFVLGFDPIFGNPDKIVSDINKAANTDFSANAATAPYFPECLPNSAFIRRFSGTGHGEIVTAYLDENYESDTVTVYIPHYDGTQYLKIEYGPDYSLSETFPLDGSIGGSVINSEIIDTEFGGRIIRLAMASKYDFRYALTFLAVIR